MLYGLNDFCIVPKAVSDINSRSECNSYFHNEYGKRRLPLFSAPMSCVIDEKNWEKFSREGINTIIPRNISIYKRIGLSTNTFVALSLNEFKKWFIDKFIGINGQTPGFSETVYICVDLANGHMKNLIDLCAKAKELHGDTLQLMTGNIANPDTYLEYAKAGIDYIRIGIGSGNVCTTAANTGIHYPMGSLIQECVKHKEMVKRSVMYPNNCDAIKSIPKIVADGGFKNFDQIIKALALGADYCMLGEIFAKTVEACGQIYHRPHKIHNLRQEDNKWYWEMCGETRSHGTLPGLSRDYYGMSTKRAQMEMGVTDPEKLKTAEGIVKQVTIDYTLAGWIDNFMHYIRSTMSYTECRTIQEFIGQVRCELMSPQAFHAFYK